MMGGQLRKFFPLALVCGILCCTLEQSTSFFVGPKYQYGGGLRHWQICSARIRRQGKRRTQSWFLAAIPKDQKAKEDIEEDTDDDFSKWISSNLKQWPLVSVSSSDQNTTGSASGQDAFEQMNENTPRSDVEALSEQQQTSFWKIWNLEALLNLTSSSILGDTGSFISSNPKSKREESQEEEEDAKEYIETTPSNNDNTTAIIGLPLTRDWATLEDLAIWNNFFRRSNNKSTSNSSMIAATKVTNQTMVESWIRQATNRVESIVADASAVLSTEAIEKLVSTRAAAELLETAKRIALDRGMNVSIAARESANFARSFFQAADASIEQGRLFEDFKTVSQYLDSAALFEAGKRGALAGAIYEDTVARTRLLGESIVARGTTNDVVWLVTDGFDTDGLVRTITIRGYDASDEEVDREKLLNNICTALPATLKGPKTLSVHSGLLQIAREIYGDVKTYITWMAPAPEHRLVLNGHSVGGSLSLLVLFLLVKDFGIDFVKKTVKKVYMFGSPPVVADANSLEKFEIPVDMVHAYVQPWDPIVRLFSSIDALYPLVSDLGADDSTPFADGPPRTLRPLTKAIIESWEGWPRFRENFRSTANQTYYSVGIQHILLPEPTRYLADRFAAVNIPVPPVESVVKLSSKELQPLLSAVFPLDVFEISFLPQAIRSFVHHFYPAYWYPLVDYAKGLRKSTQAKGSDQTTVSREPIASKWLSKKMPVLSESKKRP